MLTATAIVIPTIGLFPPLGAFAIFAFFGLFCANLNINIAFLSDCQCVFFVNYCDAVRSNVFFAVAVSWPRKIFANFWNP